jgi:uncharacterized membrane protein (UPF0127 family)
MRVIALSLVLAIVALGCTATDSEGPLDPTTAPASSSTTVASAIGPNIPPQLEDSEFREVSVGDRELLLAIADSPGLRATGLMGVEDLGDLDGMLFFWRHEALGGFWMKDTLIPLDIVWFDADGAMVGRASMVPCTATPCPRYEPDGDADYRYAIEANPGDLDWVTESTRIIYTD